MSTSVSIGRPRWRVHFLLLPLLLVALSALPVRAAEAWDVASISGPDGALAFCRAELYDPKTNLTLALALSPAGEVNLGVKVPDAGFTKGEGFAVTLKLDDDWQKPLTAESAMAELLLMRLGKNDDFLTRLQRAKTLQLVSDADTARFNLKGSKNAIEQLRACAAAKPSASAAPSRQGLPAGLAALLQASNLQATPVSLPAVKGRAVDFAWTNQVQGQALEGGFREVPNAPAPLAALVEKALQEHQKGCPQPARQQNKPETLASLQLLTAELSCNGEFAAFLFYRTNSGIFATLVQRAPQAAAPAARTARNQIAATVRRLGQSEGQQKGN